MKPPEWYTMKSLVFSPEDGEGVDVVYLDNPFFSIRLERSVVVRDDVAWNQSGMQ